MTTINTEAFRRIEADETGFSVTCTASDVTLEVALTADERRALAEAGLLSPAPLHVELRDSGDLGLTPGAFTQHRYATAWDDGYNAGKNDLRDGHVFRTRNPHREADQ